MNNVAENLQIKAFFKPEAEILNSPVDLAVLYTNFKRKEDNSNKSHSKEQSLVFSNFRDNQYIVDLFNNQTIKIKTEEECKNLGATFTPYWLSLFITEATINEWKKINSDRENLTAADLSCGAGSFIFSLLEQDIKFKKIKGYELDSEFYKICKQLFGWNKNVEISLNDSLLDLDFEESSQGKLFLDSTFPDSTEKYDIIVGNPPYVRSQNLADGTADNLRTKFNKILSGNFDLCVPFLYQSFLALKSGAVCGLIVPNKLLKSKYGEGICNFLVNNGTILRIIDFGDNQLFENKTTYTSIIIFTNKKLKTSVNYTHYPTNSFNNLTKKFNSSEEILIPQENLQNFPWKLKSSSNSIVIDQMKSSGIAITEMFDIFQGVRTGANSIYSMDYDHLKPEKYFKSFVSGEDILKGEFKETNKILIWPYEKNHLENYQSISEEKFIANAPSTYKWLATHKEILNKRSFDKSSSWFTFSRNQNLDIMNKPKILARELMPEACFAFDKFGEFVFCSGYALIPKEKFLQDCDVFAAIMCTDTFEYQLRQHCIQIKDGWFRILKHHLKELVLPKLSAKNISEVRVILKNGLDTSALEKIDKIVKHCFKLEEIMENQITESINQYNQHSHLKKKSTKSLKNIRPKYLSSLTKEDFEKYYPVELPQYYSIHEEAPELARKVTFVESKKLPIHNWYKYTQGYSPELVHYLFKELSLNKKAKIFDPFLGSGTTILAAREAGMMADGCEISPLMTWVASLKLKKWNVENIKLGLESFKKAKLSTQKSSNLVFQDYLEKAYSKNVLKKINAIKDWISSSKTNQEQKDFLLLSLISVLEDISQIRKHGSHYRFINKTDNVGVQKLNIAVASDSADIKEIVTKKAQEMLLDIIECEGSHIDYKIFQEDVRSLKIEKKKYDAIITSPPYLNRNNYLAQQKAEFSILGLVESQKEFKDLIQKTFRSHVEAKLSSDSKCSINLVNQILDKIQLTEGNNSKIPHMISGYFEDLRETLIFCFNALSNGGQAAFVVGSSRWGGVVIPVDHILASIAEEIGFVAEKIIVTRLKGNSPQQMKAFGKIPLRESIVILRK